MTVTVRQSTELLDLRPPKRHFVEDDIQEAVLHRECQLLLSEPYARCDRSLDGLAPLDDRSAIVARVHQHQIVVARVTSRPPVALTETLHRVHLIGVRRAVRVHHVRDDRLLAADGHADSPHIRLWKLPTSGFLPGVVRLHGQ
jgi:hypothetical protein